jgi:uncharacterized protein (DUF302 family)
MNKIFTSLVLSIIPFSGTHATAPVDKQIRMDLRMVHIEKDFAAVTRGFEAETGLINIAEILALTGEGATAETIKANIEKQLAGKKLAIFARLPMGLLYSTLKGSAKQAMKYSVGNPFPAMELLSMNNTAASFVPLTVNIYADDSGTVIEYLVPSTVIQHISIEPKAVEIGQYLDSEMDRIIEKIKD